MKIGIIGGGWYGCHLAIALIEIGIDVTIFEKGNTLFSGSSGFNIGRVHQGYHYPRSSETIREIQENFKLFEEKYSDFLFSCELNTYGISSNNSKTSWENYIKTLYNHNLPTDFVDFRSLDLVNLEGVLNTKEKFINTSLIKKHFEEKLNIVTKFNVEIFADEIEKNRINNKSFDWIINCTSNELKSDFISNEFIQQNCVYILKRKKKPIWDSLTIMDGAFFSITPISQDLDFYYLYDVEIQNLGLINDNEIKQHYNKTKELVKKNFPSFDEHFEFVDFIKTKKHLVESTNVERTIKLNVKSNYVSVFPSKITSVFAAEEKIKKIIFEN